MQININKQFWPLDPNIRNNFVLHTMKRFKKRRSTAGPNSTRILFEERKWNRNEGMQNVCSLLFLGCLPENNRILKIVRNSTNKVPSSLAVDSDRRGRRPNKNKIDESTVLEHILLFRPTK